MKIIFPSLISLCLLTISYNEVIAQQNLFGSSSNKLTLKHQVLLTNDASFKDHKNRMYGASSFLIKFRDKIFAVTAKHLLGEAMGIDPEIKISEFNKYLINWKMQPRVPNIPRSDTVIIGPMKLNYDSLDTDILLLEVANSGFNTFPLEPNFNLPKKGDKLYIIGCPYSQANCKQNIYEIFYESFDERNASLYFIIKTKFELPGFSGAPIVDANGKVVCILTSGWEFNKKKYVGGTFIKEIQKVK